MAVVREINYSDTYVTYLSTVALLCGISCTIVMIKFRWFKASLNLSSPAPANGKNYELASQVSVVGAYRANREEYFGNVNYLDGRKTITPSMVKLPPSARAQVPGNVKTSKSTGDLTKVQNIPAEVRKSTPNVSVQNTSQGTRDARSQSKEQKKLEKERLIEQKKREKLEAQEREKQEKLRKEREKQASQQQAKEAKEREKRRNKKGVAPQPQQAMVQQKITYQRNPVNTQQREQRAPKKNEAPPPPQFKKVNQRVQPNMNPLSQNSAQNSRNSLESSISRSSGPPPYSDGKPEIVPNTSDDTGNTSFGTSTVDASSWDMITQHRQQINRTTGATVHNPKQKKMDLQYDVGNFTNEGRDNSEARVP